MISTAGKALSFREGVDTALFHTQVWPRVNICATTVLHFPTTVRILSTLIQHLRASHTSHTK